MDIKRIVSAEYRAIGTLCATRSLAVGQRMTLTDAMLVLLLAERIHGTDDAVRTAAKNVVKKFPRSKRDVIYRIMASDKPAQLIGHLAASLDD